MLLVLLVGPIKKFNKETDRKILTWSHYSFRARLVHKAALTGSRVVLTSEEYTSQTCGWQHAMLKGSKIFHCPNP
jgi:transposase